MARRSRKRSATNSDEPPELVFFVDRGLGTGDVPTALRAAGANVEVHDDYFDVTADDATWIAEVCQKGWVILSKDKAIRRRADERQRIIDGVGRAFFLTSGTLSGREMAEIFVKHLSLIHRASLELEPPTIATVNRSGVRVYDESRQEWVTITEAKRRRRKARRG